MICTKYIIVDALAQRTRPPARAAIKSSRLGSRGYWIVCPGVSDGGGEGPLGGIRPQHDSASPRGKILRFIAETVPDAAY